MANAALLSELTTVFQDIFYAENVDSNIVVLTVNKAVERGRWHVILISRLTVVSVQCSPPSATDQGSMVCSTLVILSNDTLTLEYRLFAPFFCVVSASLGTPAGMNILQMHNGKEGLEVCYLCVFLQDLSNNLQANLGQIQIERTMRPLVRKLLRHYHLGSETRLSPP